MWSLSGQLAGQKLAQLGQENRPRGGLRYFPHAGHGSLEWKALGCLLLVHLFCWVAQLLWFFWAGNFSCSPARSPYISIYFHIFGPFWTSSIGLKIAKVEPGNLAHADLRGAPCSLATFAWPCRRVVWCHHYAAGCYAGPGDICGGWHVVECPCFRHHCLQPFRRRPLQVFHILQGLLRRISPSLRLFLRQLWMWEWSHWHHLWMAQLPDWAPHVSGHDSFAIPEVSATGQEHLQETWGDVCAGECLETYLDDVSSGSGWCGHEAVHRIGASASLWKEHLRGWRFQSSRGIKPDPELDHLGLISLV